MTAGSRPRVSFVQRALSGHAAIGLIVGALLYVICLTGSLTVIHERWQRWEQPAVTETATLGPAAAQAAMRAVLTLEKGKPRTTHLYVRMPTDDLPRAVVTTDSGGWYVDGVGRIVAREQPAWTEFVIGLHEYLHLPATWGLILVGGLGVALAALTITGVLAHPRILRDAFRLRTRHDQQIARADWHNRLGVWTLPFALAIALTGAFLGLNGVGAGLLARAYTGGDVVKVYAPIFGRDPAPDRAEAPLPDIVTALRTLTARVPVAVPTYLIVHDPGTRGQHVQIIAEHPRRLIYGETYAFDAGGRWRGPVGLADGAIGQQAAASTYNLHFGNFGGPVIEIAYVVLGFALCAIISTGISLWLQKRRRRGLPSVRLRACWDVVVWGSPLILVLLIWLRAVAGPEAPLPIAFWGLLAVGLAVAAARPAWVDAPTLRRLLLLSIIGTAIVHMMLLRPFIPGACAIDVIALLAAGSAVAMDKGVRMFGGRRLSPARA